MLTNGRFSNGLHKFIIGHITPEAQVGGLITLTKDDEKIMVDAKTNRIDFIDTSAKELAQRKEDGVVPPLKPTRGALYKLVHHVKSALEGCVADEQNGSLFRKCCGE